MASQCSHRLARCTLVHSCANITLHALVHSWLLESILPCYPGNVGGSAWVCRVPRYLGNGAIGITNYQATLAMWGVLHGFAGCQASSAMGGSRHSAFVPFSRPPPRSKGASVNCKGLQWCTVGSVPLDSPLVWGACFALRTSGVRDA